MRAAYLLILVIMGLESCSDKESVTHNNSPKTIAPIIEEAVSPKTKEPVKKIVRGIEATTQGLNYLLSKKEIKNVIDKPISEKGNIKIIHGATVYICQVENDIAKVRTLTSDEGWISVKRLRYKNEMTDSSTYYKNREFGYILANLAGRKLPYIKLWNDTINKETVKGKCFEGDKVVILQKTKYYYKVGTVNGNVGWCMSGFID